MSQSKRYTENFPKLWQAATDDSDLTLYGFRRFKTSHLLNLRFLEEEIAEIDHKLYQAGLGLGIDHPLADRLGLKDSKKDAKVPRVEDTITEDLVLRLRTLCEQYDNALIALNKIMDMEVFSLLDDEKQCSTRTDLTLSEMYKTRLLRVDLMSRARTDPLQDWIHRGLRNLHYWRISSREKNRKSASFGAGRAHRWSYEDLVYSANIMSRLILTLLTSTFLIVPLGVMSESSSMAQLFIIGFSIVAFSVLVATALKVSSFEMMAMCAGYAAVISAFMANS
ncbi:hypothetical protein PFICI_13675 [Pestalotiopsis fici W106-1]|uniref:DUF6594 domain-containing protein n=1 Tax=Pestalotiopsis fici (strain W106-1 / CGMCC3.15140) TaxID=1229662 RepID=W3WQT2_PESFW|nr:uncharacterized protein PFICI_13675 [Pestalotiopsis fici W106-1]ETS75191.1 hypothetical protein PFICI_13675 [Pestalotiopsis fici W106-1]